MNQEIELSIGGQRLKIRTDEDESYMRELAALVDERMRELGHGQRGVTSLTVALLAALRISDQLRKAEEQREAVEAALQRIADQTESALEAASG